MRNNIRNVAHSNDKYRSPDDSFEENKRLIKYSIRYEAD